MYPICFFLILQLSLVSYIRHGSMLTQWNLFMGWLYMHAIIGNRRIMGHFLRTIPYGPPHVMKGYLSYMNRNTLSRICRSPLMTDFTVYCASWRKSHIFVCAEQIISFLNIVQKLLRIEWGEWYMILFSWRLCRSTSVASQVGFSLKCHNLHTCFSSRNCVTTD